MGQPGAARTRSGLHGSGIAQRTKRALPPSAATPPPPCLPRRSRSSDGVRAALLLTAALNVAGAAARAQSLTAAQIANRWGDSIVTIVTPHGSGAGFFLPRGPLITAYHVLDGSDSAIVVFRDGRRGKVVGVIDADKDVDIAMVRCDTLPPRTNVRLGPIPAYPVYGPLIGNFATVSAGDRAVVIDSPAGHPRSIVEGAVKAKRVDGGISHLTLSAGIPPGSSGAPVFNDQGQVIGVVVDASSGAAGARQDVAFGSNEIRRSTGLPLALIFGSQSASAPDPDEAHVEDLARNSSRDGDVQILKNCPDISIEVEFGTDKHGVEAGDVERWTQAELARSAPGLAVTHAADIAARPQSPWGSSVMDTLARFDDISRVLHLRVFGPPDVGVQIEILRAAVVPSGLRSNIVENDSEWAPDGAHDFPSDLRSCVEKAVRRFADNWMIANKAGAAIPPAPATSSGAP